MYTNDVPADGGMNRWDQPIEFYITALMPMVNTRDVAKLIGDMVLEIRPYSSFIGWYYDGNNVYGLEEGTELIFNWGEYAGYTATVTNLHYDTFMHLIDFAVTTEDDTPVMIQDVDFFELWEIFGAIVKFDCESNATRLTHGQFCHCFVLRHVI